MPSHRTQLATALSITHLVWGSSFDATTVMVTDEPRLASTELRHANTAALLNATPALWIAWPGTFGSRKRPLPKLRQPGLGVGLLGVALVTGYLEPMPRGAA